MLNYFRKNANIFVSLNAQLRDTENMNTTFQIARKAENLIFLRDIFINLRNKVHPP